MYLRFRFVWVYRNSFFPTSGLHWYNSIDFNGITDSKIKPKPSMLSIASACLFAMTIWMEKAMILFYTYDNSDSKHLI